MRRMGLIGLGMVVLTGVVGCDDDGPTGPSVTETEMLTVDAESEDVWALVDLGTTPALVSAADPSTSMSWDLGFQTTGVRVNGGAGGPGDVATYCICQNADASDEDYQAMTPETELADFEAISAADIPPENEWDTGTTENGEFGSSAWYRYNLQDAHHIWPTFDVYLVRSGSEVFKVQITSYYGPAGERRQITFRSARISG